MFTSIWWNLCWGKYRTGVEQMENLLLLGVPILKHITVELMWKILFFIGRRLAQGRQKLLKHLRRGSSHNSSFRQNRSFRLRRGNDGGSKLIILIFLNIETL